MAILSIKQSETVKESINSLGLKKGYVAEALGVPAATLSRWLNRKQGITPGNLSKLFKILGINEG